MSPPRGLDAAGSDGPVELVEPLEADLPITALPGADAGASCRLMDETDAPDACRLSG